VPRRLRPSTTLVGQGPPAGRAELIIDGVFVSSETIGLDGRFEFRDVSLAARHLSRVEILLYERHNLEVPVEIREELRSASELLLPDGAVVHQGGIGVGGNAVDRVIGSPLARRGGEAGFYQGRFGLSERLTAEVGAQRIDGREQAVTGMVARLGDSWLVSAALGTAGGELGYDLSLEGRWTRWRLLARSESKPAELQRALLTDTFDHFLELGWTRGPRLDVALVARSRRTSARRTDFVLPALSWRPTKRLSLRARPDADGDFNTDFVVRAGRRLRIALRTDERAIADFQWRVSDTTVVSLTGELGGGGGGRQSALLRWQGRGRHRPGVYLGPLVGDGRVGSQVGISAELLPGILARLERVDDPLSTAGGPDTSPRLILGLTADLAVSRGRLVAGRSSAVRHDRGAVAGRLRLTRGEKQPLAGAAILLDGVPRAYTRADGSFFLGGLEPGVYRIELDPEHLPIELTPSVKVRIARVTGGAVTRVEFEVEPRYGLAGRVRDAAGAPVAGMRVLLVAGEQGQGETVAAAVTDRFGLYRMDGIRPGRYQLRLAPEDLPAAAGLGPQRRVEVVSDFLFDQDLTLTSQ
jgi:hypothetical protein